MDGKLFALASVAAQKTDSQLAVVTEWNGQFYWTDGLAILQCQRFLVKSPFGVGQTDGDVALVRRCSVDPHDGRRSQDDGPRPHHLPFPAKQTLAIGFVEKKKKKNLTTYDDCWSAAG